MKAKEITIIAFLVALLIVCSQLSIPIGPVPITLQTLAVLLIGFLLPPKAALIASTSYLLIGLVGLPVFSNFSGGLQSIITPSFGFIVAFIPATFFQSLYMSKHPNGFIVGAVINQVITYAIGLTYMSFVLNVVMSAQMDLTGILMAGLIPFIPGDILKSGVSILISKRLRQTIRFTIKI